MSELDAVATDLAPTGTLRAAINVGNPVLAQGDPADPRGVTVDLARRLGEELGLPVELTGFTAARQSFEAMRDGAADLCFLAVDPARAVEVAFTRPYVVITGVFVVAGDSPIRSAEEVDRSGVRVGVKEGSAYDLHLSRELRHAEVVRGSDGVTVFAEQGLEVGAGIRQPVQAWADERGGFRVLEPEFMQIRQAVGIPVGRAEPTKAYVAGFVERAVADGFVAEALRRSGQDETLVAKPVE